MKHPVQVFFSLGVLFLGASVAVLLIYFKPEAPQREQTLIVPNVQSHITTAFNQAIQIQSQGSVRAFRESDISAEVDGKILSLSDSFLSGMSVHKGDLLIKIDPEPYQLALTAAQTRLAESQLNLLQEQARATQARSDWQSVGRDIADASELALRKPQIALAESRIQAAQSDIQFAQRKLNQCTITAPFDGYIERTHVGLGQSVRAGTALGHIIDSQRVEIALPILNQDMGFLLFPKPGQQSEVHVQATIGQQLHQWPALLTRVVPRIGERNQQFICIAEVRNPFKNAMPLLPDLFISASINGITPEHCVEIPRDCIHEGNYVWIINAASMLEKRDVNIIRYNKTASSFDYNNETVLIAESLKPGEAICLTRLPVMAQDMHVNNSAASNNNEMAH